MECTGCGCPSKPQRGNTFSPNRKEVLVKARGNSGGDQCRRLAGTSEVSSPDSSIIPLTQADLPPSCPSVAAHFTGRRPLVADHLPSPSLPSADCQGRWGVSIVLHCRQLGRAESCPRWSLGTQSGVMKSFLVEIPEMGCTASPRRVRTPVLKGKGVSCEGGPGPIPGGGGFPWEDNFVGKSVFKEGGEIFPWRNLGVSAGAGAHARGPARLPAQGSLGRVGGVHGPGEPC